MKNLNESPKTVSFFDVIADIENNSDYTTSFELIKNDVVTLTVPLTDIYNVSNGTLNAVVDSFLPTQNTLSYNRVYSYYNYESTDIKAVPFEDTSDYPTESQFPRPHTDQVGLDGTFSITDNFTTDNLQDYIKRKCDYNPKDIEDGYYTYYYISEVYICDGYTTPKKTDGYKLINTTMTRERHSQLCSSSQWANKYGSSKAYIYIWSTNQSGYPAWKYAPETSTVDSNRTSYDLSTWDKRDEAYVYWHLPETKTIIRDNTVLEWTLQYDFNEAQQINVIYGFLYNIHTNTTLYQYWDSYSSTTYTRRYYDYFAAQPKLTFCPSAYMNTITTDILDLYKSDIMITAFAQNDIIEEWIPIGNRLFNGVGVIDLATMLHIKPTKTTKVKLVCVHNPRIISDAATKQNLPSLMSCQPIWSSSGSHINYLPAQYPRLCAASQFLPGFDVDLVDNDQGAYHYTYDTRSIARHKPLKAQIPTRKFISGRLSMKANDYYPIVYNLYHTLDELNFNVNVNGFRHNDLIGRSEIENVNVELVTFNYSDQTSFDDATILNSWDFTGIGQEQTLISQSIAGSGITVDNMDNYFFNITIKYNPNISNLLDFMTNLNLYKDDVCNYEYNFRIPQIRNKKQVFKLKSQKYDVDSTINETINFPDTNFLYIHKDATNFELESIDNNPTVYIQLTQIGNTGILDEKQIDSSLGFVNTIDDVTNAVDVTIGINTITLTDLTIHPNTNYIMVFVTNNDNSQSDKNYHSKILKYNFNYTIPITTEMVDPLISFDHAHNIVNDKDVVHYKIQYTKKV